MKITTPLYLLTYPFILVACGGAAGLGGIIGSFSYLPAIGGSFASIANNDNITFDTTVTPAATVTLGANSNITNFKNGYPSNNPNNPTFPYTVSITGHDFIGYAESAKITECFSGIVADIHKIQITYTDNSNRIQTENLFREPSQFLSTDNGVWIDSKNSQHYFKFKPIDTNTNTLSGCEFINGLRQGNQAIGLWTYHTPFNPINGDSGVPFHLTDLVDPTKTGNFVGYGRIAIFQNGTEVMDLDRSTNISAVCPP